MTKTFYICPKKKIVTHSAFLENIFGLWQMFKTRELVYKLPTGISIVCSLNISLYLHSCIYIRLFIASLPTASFKTFEENMGDLEAYKPEIAMVALQFFYAWGVPLTRAALVRGMSPWVYVVYRSGIAALVMAPMAYFSRR